MLSLSPWYRTEPSWFTLAVLWCIPDRLRNAAQVRDRVRDDDMERRGLRGGRNLTFALFFLVVGIRAVRARAGEIPVSACCLLKSNIRERVW